MDLNIFAPDTIPILKKMKTGIIVMMAAAIALAGCSAASSTSGSNRKELKKEQAAASFDKTASVIDSGNYQFTIRSATPSGGKTIQITSLYTMKATGGSYKAYLPYFGRAYAGAYGDGGSIEFDGEPENLKITRNDDKNTITVSFNIKSQKDQYTVSLEAGASGYGTLVITGDKQQSISYYGLAGE